MLSASVTEVDDLPWASLCSTLLHHTASLNAALRKFLNVFENRVIQFGDSAWEESSRSFVFSVNSVVTAHYSNVQGKAVQRHWSLLLQRVISHWKPSVTWSTRPMAGCPSGLKAEGACCTCVSVWECWGSAAALLLCLDSSGALRRSSFGAGLPGFVPGLFINNTRVWKASSDFELLKYVFVSVASFCHTRGACSELFKCLLVTLLSCCLTKSCSEDFSSLWSGFSFPPYLFGKINTQYLRSVYTSWQSCNRENKVKITLWYCRNTVSCFQNCYSTVGWILQAPGLRASKPACGCSFRDPSALMAQSSLHWCWEKPFVPE